MNEVVSAESELGFMAPRNMKEAMEFANIIAESEFIPKEYQRKPGNILVSIQLGNEVGLGPIQSLQTIAVINGRPAIYGDGMLALVQSSPLCENFEEGYDEQQQSAWCRVKRAGRKERVSHFSMDDAKQAKLQGKQGPWSMYPKRMCQMRARSWALRDEFADVLKGMSKMRLADELVIKDVTPPKTEVVDTHTGEIIEAVIEIKSDVREAALAAMAMIKESINQACNLSEMKTLKREILELPQGYQTELVQLWNARKKQLESEVVAETG